MVSVTLYFSILFLFLIFMLFLSPPRPPGDGPQWDSLSSDRRGAGLLSLLTPAPAFSAITQALHRAPFCVVTPEQFVPLVPWVPQGPDLGAIFGLLTRIGFIGRDWLGISG